MKSSDINIRDPFVLYDNGVYYLYGTRAKKFGRKVNGFDVYKSENLVDFSEPHECFKSSDYGLNRDVNWAPEVHKYKNSYYMFCTFTQKNGHRGVYILKADSPEGPFVPHSDGAVNPTEWECLDGTLYVDKNGCPYMVFCHEHTQILDGTVCYIKLSDDLTKSVGEPVYIFSGSSPKWADKKLFKKHFITDGPFMYTTKSGELLMLWSTFIKHKYAQCIAKSDNGDITGKFVHLDPIIKNGGGHGMIFKANDKLMLTYHTPNETNFERPVFIEIADKGSHIEIL